MLHIVVVLVVFLLLWWAFDWWLGLIMIATVFLIEKGYSYIEDMVRQRVSRRYHGNNR